MNIRVVICIRRGVDEHRQERVVLKYCDEHGYIVESRCDTPLDCAQVVQAGLVDLVVASHDVQDGLRHLVRLAGGRVEFVRRTRKLPTARDIIRRMSRDRRTPEEIARMIGSETTDVRFALKLEPIKQARHTRERKRGGPY